MSNGIEVYKLNKHELKALIDIMILNSDYAVIVHEIYEEENDSGDIYYLYDVNIIHKICLLGE